MEPDFKVRETGKGYSYAYCIAHKEDPGIKHFKRFVPFLDEELRRTGGAVVLATMAMKQFTFSIENMGDKYKNLILISEDLAKDFLDHELECIAVMFMECLAIAKNETDVSVAKALNRVIETYGIDLAAKVFYKCVDTSASAMGATDIFIARQLLLSQNNLLRMLDAAIMHMLTPVRPTRH